MGLCNQNAFIFKPLKGQLHITQRAQDAVCALVRAYVNACVLEPTALTLAVNVTDTELHGN